MYGAEWRDPEGASFAMLLQGVLTKIAGIARDRRHRRNLALPITAITRDYGDLGDWTVRTPWSGMAEDTSSGSLHSAPNISLSNKLSVALRSISHPREARTPHSS